jgi:ribosomal protein S18 acetylase RimI-like enzyme
VIETRPARRSDVDAVLSLWRAAAKTASISDDEPGLVALLERDPNALIVATDGGRVVGSLIVGWDGWRCSLYRLVVAPDERRRGIGAALVEEGRRRAEAFGARRIDALVDVDNDEAARFWEALGFRPNPRYVRYEAPAGGAVPPRPEVRG